MCLKHETVKSTGPEPGTLQGLGKCPHSVLLFPVADSPACGHLRCLRSSPSTGQVCRERDRRSLPQTPLCKHAPHLLQKEGEAKAHCVSTQRVVCFSSCRNPFMFLWCNCPLSQSALKTCIGTWKHPMWGWEMFTVPAHRFSGLPMVYVARCLKYLPAASYLVREPCHLAGRLYNVIIWWRVA